MNDENIVFEEVSRDFRTEIPNILFDLVATEKISPYAFILYSFYRRTAGEQGKCWKGMRTLCSETKISMGQISKARKELEAPLEELGGKSLIKVVKGIAHKHQSDTVVIVDIWKDNHQAFFKKCLSRSSHEHPRSYGETPRSPGEHKKEPSSKNKPYEETPPPNPPQKTGNAISRMKPKSYSVGNGNKNQDHGDSETPSASEEDFSEIKILLEGLGIPNENWVKFKPYSLDQVKDAIAKSSIVKVKKSLTHLLLHIIKNPNDYADPECELSDQQKLAVEHNRRLREAGFTSIADKNESAIKENYMHLFDQGRTTTCSLKGLVSTLVFDIEESDKFINQKRNQTSTGK